MGRALASLLMSLGVAVQALGSRGLHRTQNCCSWQALPAASRTGRGWQKTAETLQMQVAYQRNGNQQLNRLSHSVSRFASLRSCSMTRKMTVVCGPSRTYWAVHPRSSPFMPSRLIMSAAHCMGPE